MTYNAKFIKGGKHIYTAQMIAAYQVNPPAPTATSSLYSLSRSSDMVYSGSFDWNETRPKRV